MLRRWADRAQSFGERLRCEVPDEHVIFVLRHGHRDRVGIVRVPRNRVDRAARAGEDFLEARRFGDVVDVHCERRAVGRAAHTASSTR